MYSVNLVDIFTEYVNITFGMLGVNLLYIFLHESSNTGLD